MIYCSPKPGLIFFFVIVTIATVRGQVASRPDTTFVETLKKQALASVDSKAKSVQEMVDMVFSFGELGFQEFETSKYLTGVSWRRTGLRSSGAFPGYQLPGLPAGAAAAR